MKKDKCLPRVLLMKNADKVGAKIGAKDANKIELSELMLFCVVGFCENAAQLGCPRDKDVDMWVRELPVKKALKVMDKLLTIIEKDYSNE